MNDAIATVLSVDDSLLAAHPELYGPDAAERTLALTAAIATSPAWARMRTTAVLAVRPTERLVGIIGRISREHRPLIDAFGWHVQDLLARLRPITYAQVERACFELARQLGASLTESELARCHLVPIPRGGSIVAGILAYAAGLSRAQMRQQPTGGIAILVDDCAISGKRLQEELRRHRDREVIVVLLHAHPDLRRRIEKIDTVRACLVACELMDHAVARPDYAEWKQRWTTRFPDDLWIGDPDHVCYPWNEPDALIWNEATNEAERGWRVVPPAWCVKNRAAFRDTDVQVCIAVEGTLKPADDVIWGRIDDTIVLASRGMGKAIVLRNSAAAIWQALIDSGDRDAMEKAMAGTYRVDRLVLRRDLDHTLAALIDRGVLISHDS